MSHTGACTVLDPSARNGPKRKAAKATGRALAKVEPRRLFCAEPRQSKNYAALRVALAPLLERTANSSFITARGRLRSLFEVEIRHFQRQFFLLSLSPCYLTANDFCWH